MTIVGSISEGLFGDRTLLNIKSTLDGVTAIALTTSYGIGVLFSSVPMLIFQGLTLLASFFGDFLIGVDGELTSTGVLYVGQLKAVGGILIVGISLNILNITTIKIANLLPSLLFVIPITWIIILLTGSV